MVNKNQPSSITGKVSADRYGLQIIYRKVCTLGRAGVISRNYFQIGLDPKLKVVAFRLDVRNDAAQTDEMKG